MDKPQPSEGVTSNEADLQTPTASGHAATDSTVRATPRALRDQTLWQVAVTPTDPVRGPADALVTIVMWGDFECPFTARSRGVLARLDQRFPGQLRVVWKDNPLPFHKQAKPAATVARYAFERGGNELFWKAHDLLFEAPRLDADVYRKIAEELGLNPDELSMVVDSNQYETQFQELAGEAFDLQVSGSPHFFINGRRIPGAQPYEIFEEVVASRLEGAHTLLAAGVEPARVYDRVLAEGRPPGAAKTSFVPHPTSSSPAKGPRDASVLVQLWCEFEAAKCAAASAAVERVTKEVDGRIRFVWRHLPEIGEHIDSLPAAEASQEVYSQKGPAGFWAFHDQLLRNQNALLRSDLERYAAALSVDRKKFTLAMDRHLHEAFVREDMAAARALGYEDPPVVTVNDYVLRGPVDPGQLERTIQRALGETQP